MATEEATTEIAEDVVVNLDQVRASATADARTQAGEIAALCALAGYPDLAAEHIKSGASLDVARQSLQMRRAADDAKRKVDAIDTSTADPAAGALAKLHTAANGRFAEQAKTYA